MKRQQPEEDHCCTVISRWLGVLLLLASLGCGLSAVLIARSITLENPENDRVYWVFGLLIASSLTVFLGSYFITESLLRFAVIKKIKYDDKVHTRLEKELVDLVAAFSLAVTTFWVAFVIMTQSKSVNYYVSGFVLVVVFFCCLLIFNDHLFFFRAIWRAFPSVVPLIKRLAKIETKEQQEEERMALLRSVKQRDPELTYNAKQVLTEAENEFYEY